MKKIALFPGSFDPITVAHVDILKRSMPLFDKIVVGIGLNSSKQHLLSSEIRKKMIAKVFENETKVKVATYEGLTADFCVHVQANYMIRGVRSAADFEYERALAQINSIILPEVETILILSKAEYSAISSTIVRDILRYKGDIKPFVPEVILPYLEH